MKKVSALLLLVSLGSALWAQKAPSDEAVVRGVVARIVEDHRIGFVDRRTKEVYPSTAAIPEGANVYLLTPTMDWHYSTGILNMALVHAADYFGEPSWARFALDQVNFAIATAPYFEQRKDMYFKGPYHFLWKHNELDYFATESAAMMDLLQLFPGQPWDDYLALSEKHYRTAQPRLKDGTLVRTWPYEYTIWADDLMAMIYPVRLARYGGDKKLLDDAVRQVENFNKYLWNPSKELYYHAWYDDIKRQGGAHWGRCNGWVMLGTTWVLDALPENHPRRAELIDLLTRQILGVARYQNSSGLWHQLLDKPDSYLETSCTAIFTYCTARAINRGWLDARYANIALEGWKALCRDKIGPDGGLADVCVGTGIGNDLLFYYNRPVKRNDIHGMGLVIDTGIEIIELKKKLQ